MIHRQGFQLALAQVAVDDAAFMRIAGAKSNDDDDDDDDDTRMRETL